MISNEQLVVSTRRPILQTHTTSDTLIVTHHCDPRHIILPAVDNFCPTLVLTTQAIFLSEHGQTDTHTEIHKLTNN